jgi:hypothetical protein
MQGRHDSYVGKDAARRNNYNSNSKHDLKSKSRVHPPHHISANAMSINKKEAASCDCDSSVAARGC